MKNKFTINETIETDCKTWEKLNNENTMIPSYLRLCETNNSKESGLYILTLNNNELWYGTLQEINAIVKSMIVRLTTNDFLCQ